MNFKQISLITALSLGAVFNLSVTTSASPQKVEGDLIIVSYVPTLADAQKMQERLRMAEQKRIEEEQAKQLEIERLETIASKKAGGTNMGVPNGYTGFKSYMGYKAITNKASAQYKVNRVAQSYTDSMGMRRIRLSDKNDEIRDDYVVAMGTYYGKAGDRFSITMASGHTITATMGDLKANKHTDSTNRKHRVDGSVVEFLVDSGCFTGNARRMGDISHLKYSWSNGNEFQGSITNINKLNDNVLNW